MHDVRVAWGGGGGASVRGRTPSGAQCTWRASQPFPCIVVGRLHTPARNLLSQPPVGGADALPPPTPCPNHPHAMQVEDMASQLAFDFRVRIGMHTGPAYSGVVGIKCPRQVCTPGTKGCNTRTLAPLHVLCRRPVQQWLRWVGALSSPNPPVARPRPHMPSLPSTHSAPQVVLLW